MLGYVEQGDEVVVERHGKPTAVVVPVVVYEELQALREKQRRAEARELLDRLNERIAARNAGSTKIEEEAIEFAVKLGREINRAAAARVASTVDHDYR